MMCLAFFSKEEDVMRKRCSKCRKSKEIKHFSKNASMPDGYSHYCKKCNKERLAVYFAGKKGKAAMKRASLKRKLEHKQK